MRIRSGVSGRNINSPGPGPKSDRSRTPTRNSGGKIPEICRHGFPRTEIEIIRPIRAGTPADPDRVIFVRKSGFDRTDRCPFDRI